MDKQIVLVTGAAKRIGHAMALDCASAGVDEFIYHGSSKKEAIESREKIISLGRRAWIKTTDLSRPAEVSDHILEAGKIGPIYAPINSAAIFEPISMQETTLTDWEKHLAVNLTAPFLLCRGFKKQMEKSAIGLIVNILDRRADRPDSHHFPYLISTSGLAALTKSMAISLALNITVNGLALGAILPPADKVTNSIILKLVPAAR